MDAPSPVLQRLSGHPQNLGAVGCLTRVSSLAALALRQLSKWACPRWQPDARVPRL